VRRLALIVLSGAALVAAVAVLATRGVANQPQWLLDSPIGAAHFIRLCRRKLKLASDVRIAEQLSSGQIEPRRAGILVLRGSAART